MLCPFEGPEGLLRGPQCPFEGPFEGLCCVPLRAWRPFEGPNKCCVALRSL
jgi:hypothetical protein